MSQRTVWKYVLEKTGTQTLALPKGARFVSLAEQNGDVCIWVDLDPEAEWHEVTVNCCGTGHPRPKGEPLGSVVMLGGTLVLHYFSDAFQEGF